jgi:hypothetical protein
MLTLSRKFWLDLEVKRAIGALAGNSTTATVGIRFRL